MWRIAAGILHVVTAAITGYWAVRLMFLPLNGGPQSGWPPVMLGASILLLVAGAYVVIPRITGVCLAPLALAVPMVLCAVLFEVTETRCWLFSFVVALGACIIQYAASAFRKADLVPLIASLILNALRLYFAPTASSPDPMLLVLSLSPWALILASAAAGIAVLRSPTSDGSGSAGGFGHRTAHLRGIQ
jgi:hypothetical protein